jgi:hypothetical protein
MFTMHVLWTSHFNYAYCMYRASDYSCLNPSDITCIKWGVQAMKCWWRLQVLWHMTPCLSVVNGRFGKLTASIFRTYDYLNPEDDGSRKTRNAGNYLSIDTASYLRIESLRMYLFLKSRSLKCFQQYIPKRLQSIHKLHTNEMHHIFNFVNC